MEGEQLARITAENCAEQVRQLAHVHAVRVYADLKDVRQLVAQYRELELDEAASLLRTASR